MNKTSPFISNLVSLIKHFSWTPAAPHQPQCTGSTVFDNYKSLKSRKYMAIYEAPEILNLDESLTFLCRSRVFSEHQHVSFPEIKFCCCGLSSDVCNSTFSLLFYNPKYWILLKMVYYCTREENRWLQSIFLSLAPTTTILPLFSHPRLSLSLLLLITHLVIIPCSWFSCCIYVGIYDSPHMLQLGFSASFIPSIISLFFLSFSTHTGNLFHSYVSWPVMTSASCPITHESGCKCCL